MSSIKILSQNPYIFLKKTFLNADVCTEILKSFSANERSKVMQNGKNIVHRERTSSTLYIDKENKLMKPIIMDIGNLIGVPFENSEPVHFIQYKTGDEYKPHYDAIDNPREGQRLFTAIVYLNDCEGGETVFNKLDIEVKPKCGQLLVFENCFKDTEFLNPASIHSSSPLISKTKSILTVLFRNIRY